MTKLGNERNLEKYYQFYQDHGHDIEECMEQKEEIKGLIERGHLKKLQRNPQRNNYHKNARDNHWRNNDIR